LSSAVNIGSRWPKAPAVKKGKLTSRTGEAQWVCVVCGYPSVYPECRHPAHLCQVEVASEDGDSEGQTTNIVASPREAVVSSQTEGTVRVRLIPVAPRYDEAFLYAKTHRLVRGYEK
jgi:hypothetical protein